MNTKFQESKQSAKWLNFAERDLKTASLNHKHDGFTDTTCYFCHQTAEKALKAFLISKGMFDFPHTHILPTLLALCIKFDKDFSDYQDEIKILDRYYIETKYPSDIPVDYPKKEAEQTIELAKEVFKFVKEKIAK